MERSQSPNRKGPLHQTNDPVVDRSASAFAATVQLKLASSLLLNAVKVMIEIHGINFEHGPMPILLIAGSAGETKCNCVDESH
jgi:hypothetical protein